MPPFKYEDTSGLSFVKKEEKAVLVADRTPLQVLSVTRRSTSFDGHPGEQFLMVFDLDGEARALGFQIGSVESRDRFFVALQDWFNDEENTGDEPPVVALEKRGRSVIVVTV